MLAFKESRRELNLSSMTYLGLAESFKTINRPDPTRPDPTWPDQPNPARPDPNALWWPFSRKVVKFLRNFHSSLKFVLLKFGIDIFRTKFLLAVWSYQLSFNFFRFFLKVLTFKESWRELNSSSMTYLGLPESLKTMNRPDLTRQTQPGSTWP